LSRCEYTLFEVTLDIVLTYSYYYVVKIHVVKIKL